MDNPQLIALDDVVLRDELDPRLGDRDDDLIAQYADIFDALPPIEINQHNELIDGWHRVRAAEHAKKTEIAYVVVETKDDDDLADKMWDANLRHGVQYTRVQRQTHGLKLHGRGLAAKEIADRAGVGVNTVYRWTKAQREKAKQEREQAVLDLAGDGKPQKEIADELRIDQATVSRIMQNSQMGEMHKDADKLDIDLRNATRNVENSKTGKMGNAAESVAEPAIEEDAVETGEALEAAEPELVETDEAPADEEVATQDQEPEPPEQMPIPPDILKTARAVIGAFEETRPDDYVAKLEVSDSEWMTITDDSLSNELERELLTSAAAMCLWQELMIWYLGENASTFTDAFGKIGPVFVRGQAGQWSIVSKLRSILRRLRA